MTYRDHVGESRDRGAFWAASMCRSTSLGRQWRRHAVEVAEHVGELADSHRRVCERVDRLSDAELLDSNRCDDMVAWMTQHVRGSNGWMMQGRGMMGTTSP
jgi:hypothetical protein